MSTPRELDALLSDAIAAGVSPGCVALVWRDGALRYEGVHGVLASHGLHASEREPVTAAAIYDLASLTKVLATTTLAALAIGERALSLDDRLPESLAPGGYRPTLSDLLEHASGLAAHREFFAPPWSLGIGEREALLAAIREVPVAAPPRARAIYTDLGFILLGAWLEQLGGARLDALFRERVAAPLGLERELFFGRAEPLEHPRVAATEVYEAALHDGRAQTWYPLRAQAGQARARGLVHDDNCLVMAGVAGHAGLFGSARAVLELARAWLERRLPGLDGTANETIWTLFTTRSTVPGSTRRRGFDGTNPDGSGSTADALSPAAIGHLGYTGTSLWIDPDPGTGPSIYVLLTNRVHPTRDEPRIRELRRAFHRLAARA